MYNPERHNRRSIRLKEYDYASEGLYFITLCTTDRLNIFGEISNGEMILNRLGEIAKEEWMKSAEIRNNITLGEFIIMPNHFHGIIQINFQKKANKDIGKFKSPSQTIGAIIRGFKGATTKRINELIRESSAGELQFAPTNAPTNAPPDPSKESQLPSTLTGIGSVWQRNYYERIIRDKNAYNNIAQYIKDNPKNWEKDNFG